MRAPDISLLLFHAIDPVLEFLVGGDCPPGELEQRLLPFLLAHLAQLPRELVVLVIPRAEDPITATHHLRERGGHSETTPMPYARLHKEGGGLTQGPFQTPPS